MILESRFLGCSEKLACRIQLEGVKHNLTDEVVWEIARLAHGFVGADLCLFVKEACFNAMRRCLKSKLASPAEMWVST